MEEINQLSEFGKIAVFFILGSLFVLIAYGISHLLSKSKPSPGKLSTYECGEEPEGNARIQFNNRFYVIALVFLLFDVEIVFLFPWAAIFAHDTIMNSVPAWGWFSFIEMIVFVCVLLVGLVYVWMKGDLAWIRPKQLVPVAGTKIPADLYTAINAEKFTVQAFRAGSAVGSATRKASSPSATPAAGRKPWQKAAAMPPKAAPTPPGSAPDPPDPAPAEPPATRVDGPPAKPAFKPRILKKGK